MAQSQVKDMTIGNETSVLLKFTIPMLIGNVFQQFYNLIDAAVVGNFVGKNALAAVGACSAINYLYISFCMGFTTGISVLMSQYFGKKDHKSVKDVIGNSVYLITAMSLLVTIISVAFSRQVLNFLGTPESIFEDALLYTRIICCGILFMGIYNGVSAMLRALGDSTTPLIFLIIASILNVIGDIVFVIYFHMEVGGVAIATLLAQLLAALGCITFAIIKNPYFRLKKENFKIQGSLIKKGLKLGFPFAIQNSLVSISLVLLQSVVNQFGEDVIAAYTASSRIESLIQQPFASLGAALATFTGQNLGARKVVRVNKAFSQSCAIVIFFSLIMLAMMFLFGNNFIQIFVNDPNIISIGGRAICITSLFYIPLGLTHITHNLLNGAGDYIFAFVSGIVEVGARVGFSMTLSKVPAFGYWAIWYATGLTWVSSAILCIIRYLQGTWKTNLVIDNTF